MPKHLPKRITREQHLKVIVVLLILLAVLIGVSWWWFRVKGRAGDVVPIRSEMASSTPKAISKPASTPEATSTTEPASTPKSASTVQANSTVKPTSTTQTTPRLSSTAQTTRVASTEGSSSAPKLGSLELPRCDNPTFMLVNKAGRYTMLYDTTYRQAAWVAYLLTRRDVKSKGTERSDRFRSDPAVIRHQWPTATDGDYTRSGYDRGHLLPSADRDDNASENEATFLLSNVSPQRAALNRQTWKALEEQVRRWAARYDSLYVVTGPELRPGLARLKGRVGVPERFFKAILVRQGDHYQAIAYLIPNFDTVQGTFSDYAMTVDELETELGYDLFHNLPEKQERRAESLLDRTFW